MTKAGSVGLQIEFYELVDSDPDFRATNFASQIQALIERTSAELVDNSLIEPQSYQPVVIPYSTEQPESIPFIVLTSQNLQIQISRRSFTMNVNFNIDEDADLLKFSLFVEEVVRDFAEGELANLINGGYRRIDCSANVFPLLTGSLDQQRRKIKMVAKNVINDDIVRTAAQTPFAGLNTSYVLLQSNKIYASTIYALATNNLTHSRAIQVGVGFMIGGQDGINPDTLEVEKLETGLINEFINGLGQRLVDTIHERSERLPSGL